MMNPLFDPDSSAPFDSEDSAAQIDAVKRLVGPTRVCDLGCGQGRVAVPLAMHGAEVVALDRSADALHVCQQASASMQTVRGDFTDPPKELGQFDWLLCLGNTFALIHDVDKAVAVLARWKQMLRTGGAVVLDDLPGMLWPNVAVGDWCDGVDAQERQQLVWQTRDSVLTIRTGAQVDPDCWTVGADELLIRVWTDAAIHLVAQLAGFRAPEVDAAGGILVLRPVPTTLAD